MTRVQADWLTLLLAPIVLISLAVGFFTIRAAAKDGRPAPGWAKAVQAVGILCALLIALLSFVGD